MKIESLKPGMVVFDLHSRQAGNTALRTWGVWRVEIQSVDFERGSVMASWNGNPAKKFYRRSWQSWRLKEPCLVRNSFGLRRPETRAEKKARVVKLESEL